MVVYAGINFIEIYQVFINILPHASKNTKFFERQQIKNDQKESYLKLNLLIGWWSSAAQNIIKLKMH